MAYDWIVPPIISGPHIYEARKETSALGEPLNRVSHIWKFTDATVNTFNFQGLFDIDTTEDANTSFQAKIRSLAGSIPVDWEVRIEVNAEVSFGHVDVA